MLASVCGDVCFGSKCAASALATVACTAAFGLVPVNGEGRAMVVAVWTGVAPSLARWISRVRQPSSSTSSESLVSSASAGGAWPCAMARATRSDARCRSLRSHWRLWIMRREVRPCTTAV